MFKRTSVGFVCGHGWPRFDPVSKLRGSRFATFSCARERNSGLGSKSLILPAREFATSTPFTSNCPLTLTTASRIKRTFGLTLVCELIETGTPFTSKYVLDGRFV